MPTLKRDSDTPFIYAGAFLYTGCLCYASNASIISDEHDVSSLRNHPWHFASQRNFLKLLRAAVYVSEVLVLQFRLNLIIKLSIKLNSEHSFAYLQNSSNTSSAVYDNPSESSRLSIFVSCSTSQRILSRIERMKDFLSLDRLIVTIEWLSSHSSGIM